MKQRDEEILVRRAQKHDEKALTLLLTDYEEYLYQIAFLYCKDQQAALDAVSECVTKVYLNLPKLKKPEYFKTWMTRILINEVLDDIRKRKNQVSYDRLKEMGYEAELEEDSITREENGDTNQNITVTPEEVFCDGTSLYLGLRLTTTDEEGFGFEDASNYVDEDRLSVVWRMEFQGSGQ